MSMSNFKNIFRTYSDPKANLREKKDKKGIFNKINNIISNKNIVNYEGKQYNSVNNITFASVLEKAHENKEQNFLDGVIHVFDPRLGPKYVAKKIDDTNTNTLYLDAFPNFIEENKDIFQKITHINNIEEKDILEKLSITSQLSTGKQPLTKSIYPEEKHSNNTNTALVVADQNTTIVSSSANNMDDQHKKAILEAWNQDKEKADTNCPINETIMNKLIDKHGNIIDHVYESKIINHGGKNTIYIRDNHIHPDKNKGCEKTSTAVNSAILSHKSTQGGGPFDKDAYISSIENVINTKNTEFATLTEEIKKITENEKNWKKDLSAFSLAIVNPDTYLDEDAVQNLKEFEKNLTVSKYTEAKIKKESIKKKIELEQLNLLKTPEKKKSQGEQSTTTEKELEDANTEFIKWDTHLNTISPNMFSSSFFKRLPKTHIEIRIEIEKKKKELEEKKTTPSIMQTEDRNDEISEIQETGNYGQINDLVENARERENILERINTLENEIADDTNKYNELLQANPLIAEMSNDDNTKVEGLYIQTGNDNSNKKKYEKRSDKTIQRTIFSEFNKEKELDYYSFSILDDKYNMVPTLLRGPQCAKQIIPTNAFFYSSAHENIGECDEDGLIDGNEFYNFIEDKPIVSKFMQRRRSEFGEFPHQLTDDGYVLIQERRLNKVEKKSANNYDYKGTLEERPTQIFYPYPFPQFIENIKKKIAENEILLGENLPKNQLIKRLYDFSKFDESIYILPSKNLQRGITQQNSEPNVLIFAGYDNNKIKKTARLQEYGIFITRLMGQCLKVNGSNDELLRETKFYDFKKRLGEKTDAFRERVWLISGVGFFGEDTGEQKDVARWNGTTNCFDFDVYKVRNIPRSGGKRKTRKYKRRTHKKQKKNKKTTRHLKKRSRRNH